MRGTRPRLRGDRPDGASGHGFGLVADSMNANQVLNNGQTAVYIEGHTRPMPARAGAPSAAFPTPISTSNVSQTNGPIWFPQVTDATVAFDAQNNFYVLDSPHEANYGSGQLVLNKFTFTPGSAPSHTATTTVYQWAQQDAAYNPTLAVDSNPALRRAAQASRASRIRSSITSTSPGRRTSPCRRTRARRTRIGSTWWLRRMAGRPSDAQVRRRRQLLQQCARRRAADRNQSRASGGHGRLRRGRCGGLARAGDGHLGRLGDPVPGNPVPMDEIASSRIQNGGSGALSTGQTGPIMDATAPVSPSTINGIAVSDFNITVAVPVGFTADDLSVTLGLNHDNLAQTSGVLISPTGGRVTLWLNQLDDNNNDAATPASASPVRRWVRRLTAIHRDHIQRCRGALDRRQCRRPRIGRHVPPRNGNARLVARRW